MAGLLAPAAEIKVEIEEIEAEKPVIDGLTAESNKKTRDTLVETQMLGPVKVDAPNSEYWRGLANVWRTSPDHWLALPRTPLHEPSIKHSGWRNLLKQFFHWLVLQDLSHEGSQPPTLKTGNEMLLLSHPQFVAPLLANHAQLDFAQKLPPNPHGDWTGRLRSARDEAVHGQELRRQREKSNPVHAHSVRARTIAWAESIDVSQLRTQPIQLLSFHP